MLLSVSIYVFLLPSISLLGVVSALSIPNTRITPFRARFNATGLGRLIDIDRARAVAFKSTGQNSSLGARDTSISVINAAMTYTTSVGVGSPATYYTLLIDTGSSNTWVGARPLQNPYVITPSSISTDKRVSVSYGSGRFFGTEYLDTVTLSPSLVISHQSIGVAALSIGFNDVDGILGIGPVDLTQDTVEGENTIPTIIDNLYSQGEIDDEVVGIYYAPATTSNSPLANGELTFGGIDALKCTSEVTYVPITVTSPASMYWGINQSISYGGQTILASTAGIVDTGTTLVLIASDAFSKYQIATGATVDKATGLLKITSAQYAALSNLEFNAGGTTFILTPNAQIWPRALNSDIGGTKYTIYLIVGNLGYPSGSGLDFINGYTFLERYYSVYDTTNKQVGFASTAQTESITN